ncbi:MAG: hypothetical protein ACI4PF_04655 [Christensenellales bacterium]
MKKIIKKILTITCSLVLCLVCLTGCSWLEIDRNKYYNAVVVSVGDKDFYKKDLIEAFSNYGYQYYEEYNLSLEESINYTLNSMIDRWLLLEEVKKDDAYQITDEEMLEIKQQAFDYMQDSIFTYETKIREEWDMTVDSEESSTDESSLRTAEETYTPTTYYELVDEGGKLVGKVFRSESDEQDKTIVGDIKLTDHFTKSRQIITDKKVSDEAWTRYVKSLQDSAKGEGRNADEQAVLLYEENRLIELLTNNLYLEKYENAFLDELPVDTESVLQYFKDQYNSQKETYSANKSLYHDAMKNASSTYVYYHPNSGNEYVNVKHILINFTQVQKDAITAINTKYGVTNDGSEEDEKRKENSFYQNEIKAIVNQTETTFEMTDENGNKVTKTWNALVTGKDDENNVYDYVRSYVTGSTLKERCEKFNELVYIFNDDTGFMNSEFDYVVNLDTNVTDQMVKPFADGVRALDKSNGGEGEGSMSYIVSEYGIHIIFHAGNAKNLVEDNINNDEELLRVLCTTYTTPESNKSIFNFIYDTLKLDDSKYDNMTENKIKTARTELKNNGVQIVYYEKNYKDLWS